MPQSLAWRTCLLMDYSDTPWPAETLHISSHRATHDQSDSVMEDAPGTAPSGHKRRRACTSGVESEEDDAESFDDDPSEDMTTEAGTSADIANQSDAADVTRQLQARVRYADDEPNWDEVKRDAEEIGLSDAWLQGQKTAREKLWAAVKQVLPRLDPPTAHHFDQLRPSLAIKASCHTSLHLLVFRSRRPRRTLACWGSIRPWTRRLEIQRTVNLRCTYTQTSIRMRR